MKIFLTILILFSVLSDFTQGVDSIDIEYQSCDTELLHQDTDLHTESKSDHEQEDHQHHCHCHLGHSHTALMRKGISFKAFILTVKKNQYPQLHLDNTQSYQNEIIRPPIS